MNERILHQDVQEYISDHLKSDLHKLILKGIPFDGVTIQEVANQIICKQKSEKKLLSWFNAKNIYYPPKVSIEQTSSEVTASYKSGLVSGKNILDLTGGFGVDSYYFSKSFQKVIHCEITKNLSEIAAHNFKQLAILNIETISENGLEYLKKSTEIFDIIYIDPSRRNDVKEKVFLLKDCEPNKISINNALQKLYSTEFENKLNTIMNPYRSGGASEAIVNILDSVSLDVILKETFYDYVNMKVKIKMTN